MYLLSATKYLSIIFVFRLAISVTRSYKIDELKTRLLQPSLTSHYQVWVNANQNVINWIQQRQNNRFGSVNNFRVDRDNFLENLSISCCEASLPGSTFFTHDVNVYTGVTEKFAYSRSYDDRADFTFYVNTDYDQLTYFEDWMSYIANEQYNQNIRGGVYISSYNYRMNLPSKYRTDISISKFERSFGGLKTENGNNNRKITYVFKDAYPISMNSMPVSYDSSELLKCTVSFTYSRYYLKSDLLGRITPNPEGQQSTSQNEPTAPEQARSGRSQPVNTDTYGSDTFNLA